MTKKSLVFTQGTFDLMHSNHILALEEAKSLGTHLIVGVLSDEVVETYKRRPILPQEERLAQVGALKCIDEAYVDSDPITADALKARLLDIRPDHYVYFGDGFDDQFVPAIEMGILRRLPYHSGINTSHILDTIRDRLEDGSL